MAISPDIQRVVSQIVDRFKPQKVVLFGSHAYGKPTKDSDADLLVIIDTDQRPVSMAAGIAASIDHPVPLDVMVKTPREVAARIKSGDTFLVKVLSEGVILYEARNKRVG